MGTTFFDLKPKRRQKPTESNESTMVELKRITIPGRKSFMTYIDIDGVEKTVTGSFTKQSDGSYVINRTEVDKYDIYEKVAYTYKDVKQHFTYLDDEGKTRYFNRLDTLTYDGNSYFGEACFIKYDKTEVELFEENK